MNLFNEASSFPILKISDVNKEVRLLLEKSFPVLYIEGEISNLAKPASGHWYFSLKDERAQIKAAMFRLQNQKLSFEVYEGIHVLVKAKVTLYEERGDFQLIIEAMEPAGMGQLQRAFDALKDKLLKEGLFNEEYKKKIPYIPKQIGIITSETGAAIRDILHTLSKRFPAIPIILYPTLVQGKEAAKQIVAQLNLANDRAECDVLIVARGGGSLEDLWPFNEEIVARAIYESQIPIITGIGHQTDFTISDFVADVRAPTPTGAAVIATPERHLILEKINQLICHMQGQLLRHYQQLAQRLDMLYKRLQSLHPEKKIKDQLRQQLYLNSRLKQSMHHHYEALLLKQQQLSKHLVALSPKSTLARGYAIAQKQNGSIIRKSSDLKTGEIFKLLLAENEVACIKASKTTEEI